jgi:hypothetical protein
VDGLHKGVDSLRPHVRIDAVSQVGNPTASSTEFLHHLHYRSLDGLVRAVEAARVQVTLNRKKELTKFKNEVLPGNYPAVLCIISISSESASHLRIHLGLMYLYTKRQKGSQNYRKKV